MIRIRVRCPKCGSTNLDRANHDVVIYEHFEVIPHVDYVIEGGNERRITYHTIQTIEDGEHFIEELDSSELEFQCATCMYFFEGISSEEDLLEFAESHNLLVEEEIEDDKNRAE
jgi:hypothetical protein